MGLKFVYFRLTAGILTFGAAVAIVPSVATLADEGHGHAAEAPKSMMEGADHALMTGMMRMPEMNAERGMILFVEKGCVACHSVNEVGGHDATPLDAHGMEKMMNPFEFAAKMWSMAPAMIAAQEEAFGEQIRFTGDELADIIAFVHDDAQQHKFNEAMLSARVRKMMNHQHGGTAPEASAGESGHMR